MTTLTAAPERSLEQRLDALQRANKIRTRRAQLKRDLKAGRRDVALLISRPPSWLATMKVYDLLLALPKVGRVKALAALRRAQVSPSKTIGGLSARQRRDLLVHLPDPVRKVGS